MQFWQPGWKLCCHKSKKFMFQVRNKWKLAKLSKIYFNLQIDTPKTKSTIFNFDTPAQKFFAKHGKCSFKVLKNLINKENFQNFDFLIDLVRRKLHFSILISLPKTFSPSTVNVRSKFRIVWKKTELPKKILLKMFLWTRRMQFWETGRRFSATVQKKFLLKLCHFYYQHLEENSYRHLECLFDNPGENSVATNPKILYSKSEINKNFQNFRKIQSIIFIPNMILWRHKVQFSFLISLHKTFSSSRVNVRSKIWRVWKKIRSFKSCFFYSKCSFGHVECSFNKQVKNFPPSFKKSFFLNYFTSNTNISKRIQIDT